MYKMLHVIIPEDGKTQLVYKNSKISIFEQADYSLSLPKNNSLSTSSMVFDIFFCFHMMDC